MSLRWVYRVALMYASSDFVLSGNFAAQTNRFASSTYHRQRRIDKTVRSIHNLLKHVAYATYNPNQGGRPLWESQPGAAGHLVPAMDVPEEESRVVDMQGTKFQFDSFRSLIDFFKDKDHGQENEEAIRKYLRFRLRSVAGMNVEKEILEITLSKRLQYFSYWPSSRS